ncbi:MAG: AAA family ATPase [Deltaproteobacteria bacterium]|nr:AAA family ATPase [Deltaproteobacteria bacterium]MBW2153928.1 AAA family ATPase [Deltaproteobacteria bacterium]
MQETPLEYVQLKGWDHKLQSGQIVIKTCPYCQDEKWHFYLDREGPFFCHKCNERGNLVTLKKHLGNLKEIIRPAFQKRKTFKKPETNQADRYHQALLKDQSAMEYVRGRGISIESVKRFKLGLFEKNGIRWLSIPHYRNNNLVNIKFRSLPPAEKDFRRIPGCESILFNCDCLKAQQEIFLTEGELDAITLIQAGIENTVSGTTGAGSFDPEWIDILKPLKRIYLCYDADDSGQQGARSLAKRLGYNRCFNVELPEGQDINDYFNSGNDIFAFQNLVNQARRFDLPGVISMEAAFDLLAREKSRSESDTGLLTPWQNVNHLVKSFRPGDLIIVSAPPKTGKTTWCLNIGEHLTLQNIPVLFFCLEMRPERLTYKLIQSAYRKENLSSEDIEKARNEFSDIPLYFGHSFKKQKLEDVLQLIREAIQRYDLKLVIFDNLHFLIRSVSNVNEELGQAVQGFKLLAEEMEIPIIAIAQPRKREGGARDEIMRAEDIKYSNAIHADCDQMIILYRKRKASNAKEIGQSGYTVVEEALDPVTLIRVEAHRYGAGGETLLYFHGEYSRFEQMEGKA